jgi:phage shock protein PspC (stress-responsive transcriptional regulator)
MSEKKILGVCSWVSEKFDLNVSGIRILFIVAAILSLGSPILIYLILYLVKPKKI